MFLQSAYLLGLLAVLVPILVHLLSRQQVMRVELGTTRFLYEVLSDTSRRRRIRRWFLLLTRMAIAGIVALMFARPSLPTLEDMLGSATHVMLVDRSASMQMPGQSGRAFDDALAAARDSVQRFGKNSKVLWAAFDSHVEAVDAQASAVPRITPRPAADTNYAGALAWARDRLESSNTRAQVWLITDCQMSGLSGQGELGNNLLPDDVPLKIIDVGGREAQNVALQTIDTRVASSGNEEALSITASIFNFGSLPTEDLLVTAVAVNGSQTLRLKKTIDVAATQASEASFDFGKVQPGIWQITIDVDIADDLAFDNRRLFACEVHRPDPILVIDNGSQDSPQASSSYYLTLALNTATRRESLPEQSATGAAVEPEAARANAAKNAATGRSQFDARQWFWRDQGEPNLNPKTVPLVVVADACDLSAALVDRLESYAQAGGHILFFAGRVSQPDMRGVWQSSSLMPGTPLRHENASTMPFRITDLQATSAMLAPFLDPQTGDLSRLAFTSLLSFDIAHQDRILARFDGKRPAITEHAVGAGRVAWFMSSADDSAGSWTTSPLYLPLIHQMAADLLGRTGEGPIRFRSTGDALPEQALAAAAADKSKRGTTATASAISDSLYFDQPGFIRLPPDGPLYVVNPSPRESDPTRVEPSELAQQLGARLLDDESVDDQARATASYLELWPYFAAALVTLVILEFALANRTTA